jgi:hypothetical protein
VKLLCSVHSLSRAKFELDELLIIPGSGFVDAEGVYRSGMSTTGE